MKNFDSDSLLMRNSVLKEFAIKEFADDHRRSSVNVSKSSDCIDLTLKHEACFQDNPAELADRISEINLAVEQLGGELRRLVADNYEQFIERSGSCSLFQQPLQQLHDHVIGLRAALQRLKQSLGQPYEQLSTRMRLLTRLQNTCDLMRALIRIIGAGKRLSNDSTNTIDLNELCSSLNRDQQREIEAGEMNMEQLNLCMKELTRQASAVAEVKQIEDDYDRIREIKIAKEVLHMADERRSLCERLAHSLLITALSLSDTQLATGSMLVLHTLDQLQSNVDRLLQQKLQIVQQSCNRLIEEQVNASRLWPTIEQIVQCLLIQNAQINALGRVLRRRRDLLSNISSESASTVYCLTKVDAEFARKAAEIMLQRFQQAAARSIIFRDALEGQFPKLLRLFVDLQPVSSESIDARRLFHTLLSPFESAYLSRSLSSLIDSVDLVFGENRKQDHALTSTGDCPVVRKDIDVLIQQMQTQLLVLRLDEPLGKLVTKNVCQSINLFLTRIEQLVRVGGDATQVLGPATSAQKSNAQLLDRLVHFEAKLLHVLDDVAQASSTHDVLKVLRDKMADVHALMKTIVRPLQDSILDAVDAILLTMHSENLNSGSNEGQCSLYMKELSGFMLRVQSDYLRSLPRHNALSDCIRTIGTRLLYSCLEHISLIRVPSEGPLATTVRLRLAADLAQLDKCVSGLSQAAALGRSMRALRAVRRLLLAPSDQLVDSPALSQLLPHWLAVQLLIGWFAPNELRLPHEQKGWSISRYTKWLEQHPDEQDRLLLIRDSLESYVQQMSRQPHFRQFPNIYTVIRSLLEDGLKKIPTSSM